MTRKKKQIRSKQKVSGNRTIPYFIYLQTVYVCIVFLCVSYFIYLQAVYACMCVFMRVLVYICAVCICGCVCSCESCVCVCVRVLSCLYSTTHLWSPKVFGSVRSFYYVGISGWNEKLSFQKGQKVEYYILYKLSHCRHNPWHFSIKTWILKNRGQFKHDMYWRILSNTNITLDNQKQFFHVISILNSDYSLYQLWSTQERKFSDKDWEHH